MGEGTPWLVVTFCMLQCSCTLDSVLGLRKAIGMQGVEERRGGGLIPKIKQQAKPNYSIPGPKLKKSDPYQETSLVEGG